MSVCLSEMTSLVQVSLMFYYILILRVANRHECMSLRNDVIGPVCLMFYYMLILRVANRHECMSLRNDVIGPG
jgi:hypothetical protein